MDGHLYLFIYLFGSMQTRGGRVVIRAIGFQFHFIVNTGGILIGVNVIRLNYI